MNEFVTVSEFVAEVRAALSAQSDPVRAVGQQAYMKSAMPYYGLPAAAVQKVVRELNKRHPFDLDGIANCSRALWDGAEHREERYVAIGLTGFPPAKGRLELVPLYEHQVRTGAWWDFVDDIAHRIADLHDAHPGQTARIVRDWSRSDTFWLRRFAIISQLRRKERTDTELLAEVIMRNADDKEFFIRKAIGWALRDYAYTAPDWVRAFVSAHDLSPLSRREALKHIGG
ncbi:MAG: DNA alkylation repair protein [Propionibacteriaceae bacterium]|jgi:3-methyladenine DNA glycosylase AlkD|nr:DNA alkylation repair protein [Propionibacteriaceae bacterium]